MKNHRRRAQYFSSALHSLAFTIGMIAFSFVAVAQTTSAIAGGSASSEISIPMAGETSHQAEAPALKVSDIPGSSFLQSYVDDMNPAALALQLAPVFSILGAALVALSGLVLMLQAKGIAVRMLVTGIGCAVVGAVPGLLVPVFVLIKSIPVWLMLIMAIFTSLAILGAFASIFIGKIAAAVMIGNLAAWVIQKLLLLLILPFSVLRKFFSGNGTT